MDEGPIKGYEWRNIRVRREKPVDASAWEQFVFLSADMYEVAISVLVPKGEPATKILAKKSRPRVR
jgi:hypothetical protein